jgi:hypothetical protein
MLTRALHYAPRVAKALTAAAAGWSSAYAGAVDGGVTAEEWVVVVASGLAAAVAVWLTPNRRAL